MNRLMSATAALASLGLGACAGIPPTPAISNANISPTTINPGQQITVGYTIAYAGPWSDIERIDLDGLPQNTLTANTRTALQVPPTVNNPASVPVLVNKPAADGAFPLSLRLTYRGGQTVSHPLGSLRVVDLPSSFTLAQFEPGSHSPTQCVNGRVQRSFKYAVEDDNGANDLINPQLTVVGGDPAASGPLLARADRQMPPPFRQTIALNKPNNPNDTREVVTTPVVVNCALPSPVQWQLRIDGTNQADDTNQAMAVPGKQIDYVSTK